LWAYADHVHHDIDVAEDGTIYTLSQKIIHEPPAGLEFLPMPCLTDFLVVLSPEGRELETIPLLEAFAQSPYALILSSATKHSDLPKARSDRPRGRWQPQRPLKGDVFHTNSVKVLSQALAAKFPLFQPGQVLLSLRNLDTVAVLDRSTRRVVWTAQGIWGSQHDAEFLNNGHLLLYDNLGSLRGTRIVEYDPRTQATPWVYKESEIARYFKARVCGVKQRLPNGNTFIVDPQNRRLFEVTPDRELVWESVLPPLGSRGQTLRGHGIYGARRYGADELTFLKGVARARP
jgi:hypothetical protein